MCWAGSSSAGAHCGNDHPGGGAHQERRPEGEQHQDHQQVTVAQRQVREQERHPRYASSERIFLRGPVHARFFRPLASASLYLDLQIFGGDPLVTHLQTAFWFVLVLVGVPIAMLNDLNQIAALMIASGAGNLGVFMVDQLQAYVMLFLDLYQAGLHIAFVFWGLWLFPLGFLVFKSGFLPRILGVLLIIAGFGYLFEFVTFFLVPDLEITIRMFTFWGEVFLALWLLIMGVNVEKWEERALESA